MKKQFILSKIEAVQDGSPYVYVGFIDPNDSRTGEVRQLNPFGPKAMGNIAGMMGGGGPADSLTFKLSMREYEDMSLKVGDKVSIEIKKKQDSGI